MRTTMTTMMTMMMTRTRGGLIAFMAPLLQRYAMLCSVVLQSVAV